MASKEKKKVLVSGASFAGLSTAFWMLKLGYDVTIVEVATGLKRGGTAVDIKDQTIEIAERMGVLEAIKSNCLNLEVSIFKNASDITVKSMPRDASEAGDGFEIERNVLLDLLYGLVKDRAHFKFADSIVSITDDGKNVEVGFKAGTNESYDLVIGCDGIHSTVRRLSFGPESEFSHFLNQYFSITIVDKSLIKPNTLQMYNEPNKAVMLNAYKDKTDIVLCFRAEKEISYDYRNEEEQRSIIEDQFKDVKWRANELLNEVRGSKSFYFDKLCQIKMPSWTNGRVALIGDSAYCASPAAGMGGSLAIIGAAAFYDAMVKHGENIEEAFREYNQSLRPYIEEVQTNAVSFGLDILVPSTEEAIEARNAGKGF